MKILAAFLCLVFAASLAHAQAGPAVRPAQPKVPVVKPGDPAKPEAKKEKEEPMGVIEGTTLTRPSGNFLGLTLLDGKFKLTFHEKKKKKPMKVDALRVIARWPNPHGPGNNQTILNPAGNGTFMMGSQFVRGPHSFNLTLILVLTEGENAQTETYTVPFRG
jgi:hypothetical protein